jgi:hypothetical protein
MNGGGQSGLRPTIAGKADFEGPVGYRLSLAVRVASTTSALGVLSVVYSGQPLVPAADGSVEFTILSGINVLSYVLANPEDQDVVLVEKDDFGHTNTLSQFRYSASNPTASFTIRGLD